VGRGGGEGVKSTSRKGRPKNSEKIICKIVLGICIGFSADPFQHFRVSADQDPVHGLAIKMVLSRPTYSIVIIWSKFICDKSASGMLINPPVVFTFTRQRWSSSYLALLV
jgi:hypothetical protein